MKPKEIKELRNRLGITQPMFARRLEVDSITVSRWERGVQKPGIVATMKLRGLLLLD